MTTGRYHAHQLHKHCEPNQPTFNTLGKPLRQTSPTHRFGTGLQEQQEPTRSDLEHHASPDQCNPDSPELERTLYTPSGLSDHRYLRQLHDGDPLRPYHRQRTTNERGSHPGDCQAITSSASCGGLFPGLTAFGTLSHHLRSPSVASAARLSPFADADRSNR